MYTFMLGPGAHTPRTPGGQNIHTSTWGPYRTPGTPGKPKNIQHVHKGPREVNKYTHLYEARGPHMPVDPGLTSLHIYVGPGTRTPKTLGDQQNTHLCGDLGPVRQGPGYTYAVGYNTMCQVTGSSTPKVLCMPVGFSFDTPPPRPPSCGSRGPIKKDMV